MSLKNLKRFYCCLPLSQKDNILSNGISPRRLSGGDAVRIYRSKNDVEKELKRYLSGLIVIIDGSRLNPKLFTKVDYNNLFYKGAIPRNAITISKSKTGKNNGRAKDILKKGRKL